MAVFPVVLDSCVLYNARVRDTILRAAGLGFYRVHWTAQILDDAVRNLEADGRLRSAPRLREALERSFPEASIEVPDGLVSTMTNHPGDRHVAAAAVIAHAQVIVTFNLRHFPPESIEPFGIEAQHPDRFLCHLFDLGPATACSLLASQAAALRNPPVTTTELLDGMAVDTPAFVALARPHVAEVQSARTPET